ncbi:MAG: putative ABC-type ATPase [Saprospiraceae bacterium]
MNLTVLAGPNGVGKTYYSNLLLDNQYLPCPPINTDDLSKLINEDLLPYDMLRFETERQNQIEKLFYDVADNSIDNKSNFSYESNLSSPNQLAPIGLFQGAGYEINLVYMCLPSIKDSISRVNLRKSKGGHPVERSKLEYNFEQGLKNLDATFDEWKKLVVIESNIITNKIHIAFIIKNKRLVQYTGTPECFSSALTPKLLEVIKNSDLSLF